MAAPDPSDTQVTSNPSNLTTHLKIQHNLEKQLCDKLKGNLCRLRLTEIIFKYPVRTAK